MAAGYVPPVPPSFFWHPSRLKSDGPELEYGIKKTTSVTTFSLLGRHPVVLGRHPLPPGLDWSPEGGGGGGPGWPRTGDGGGPMPRDLSEGAGDAQGSSAVRGLNPSLY